ncbi:XRE family transcriptional regulator [Shewanella sp. OPT22]|nr:XRE family transcriptional regulator [Shewanella sp. OPT22]
MEVKAQEIRSLRTVRGWTQQHLADVCGISLRTIQRVERYGTASNDTALAIASVLELNLEQLLVAADIEPEVDVENVQTPLWMLIAILVIGIGLGSGVTFALFQV